MGEGVRGKGMLKICIHDLVGGYMIIQVKKNHEAEHLILVWIV